MNVTTKTVPAGEVRFGDRLVGEGLLVMHARSFVHDATGDHMVTLKDGVGLEVTLPATTPTRIQRRTSIDDQDSRDNADILNRIMYRSNGWK